MHETRVFLDRLLRVPGIRLVREPVQHPGKARVGCLQMRKEASILEGVMGADGATVGLAERTEGPIVLPDHHAVEKRPYSRRIR